jgi:hypothetical protein
LYVK